MAAGAMPNLERLVREGQSGVLETEHPPLSPLLWTTMMTGRGPLEHGILDFTRFHPQGGREPITSDERRVPAIWNMAAAAGASASVIGLWATYPAEPAGGLVVADRVFLERRVDPSSVHPPERSADVARALTDADAAVGYHEVHPFLPWLEAPDYERWRLEFEGRPYGHPVPALRRLLVDFDLVARLAAASWRQDRPRLLIAYHEGTDVAGHVFAPYAPPRLSRIEAEDFSRYSTVAAQVFRRVDDVLGGYIDLARQSDAYLFIASDHGFHWAEGRPRESSSLEGASAAQWHRDDGIYVIWDPSFPRRQPPSERPRAGVRRVCSTLLALAGLPAAKGVAAPPLPGAPANMAGAGRDYDVAFQPSLAAPPTSGADESLAQLRALGYLGAGGSTARLGTRTAGSYNNEGLLRRQESDVAGAVAAFQTALELDAGYGSAAWNLSDLLFALGREPERADELLRVAVAAGLPGGEARVRARAAELLARGRGALERRDCAEAGRDFGRATSLDPANALAHAALGTAQLCLGEERQARASFRRSLSLDPNQPELRALLLQAESPPSS